MRKAIFVLLSLLLMLSIVAIPADTISARPAPSPQVRPPSPTQQEDEEKIIKRMLGEINEAKGILDELAEAKKLAKDKDIRDKIDAIIEKVKKIEELIKAGQNEAALKEKRALSKELESLVMGYGPGGSEEQARADLNKLTKAGDELTAASEKISKLIEIETSAEQVDLEVAAGVEVVATSPDKLSDEEALIEEVLGHLDEVMNSADEGQVTTDDSGFANTIDAIREEVKRIQKLIKDGEKQAALVAKSQLVQQFVAPIMLLSLAIRAVETKLALHRVDRQLVLAFHTLQELIAAELPPAEEEEKPVEVEVAPPEVEPVEPLPGVPGAAPPTEPEEKKSEVEKAVDEHMKMLEKLRQEAEEKDKSEEEAQKSQEAFEKLNAWLDTIVEPVETEMVPLELVGREPIVVHIEMPPSEEALSPIEVPTSSRIDVSMFECITENTEAEVKITAVIIDETSETEGEIVIEVEGSEVTLIGEGAEATTTLPLVVKENKLYSGEDENLYPISLLPGDIVNGLEIAPEEISLESDENQNPVYKVCLKEEAKFLFVPLELTREIEIDAAWGDVLSITKPWWAFSASKQDIPEVFYQVKGTPCLCKYIKVTVKKKKSPVPTLVERSTTQVTVEKKKKKVGNTTVTEEKQVKVHVVRYKKTIEVQLKVKLKCCPQPKNQECTATITVKPEEKPYCSAGKVTITDPSSGKKHKIDRTVMTGKKLVGVYDDEGNKITQPLKVTRKCGAQPKTETFTVKYEIALERRLTQEEFDDERTKATDPELKDKARIADLMSDTYVSVDFEIGVACEGWEEELCGKTSATVELKSGKWSTPKISGPAAKWVEFPEKKKKKEPCKQRALIHPGGKKKR